MHTHTHAHTHIHAHTHTQTHTRTYTHAHTRRDIYTDTDTLVHTYKGEHKSHLLSLFLSKPPPRPTFFVTCSLYSVLSLCNTLQHTATHCNEIQQRVCALYSVWLFFRPLSVTASRNALCCSALQCVAVRCSALQCVAVRCSALCLHMVHPFPFALHPSPRRRYMSLKLTKTHCNPMQPTATHSNAGACSLHRFLLAFHPSQRHSLQTFCNPLQSTAIHCNPLQSTATTAMQAVATEHRFLFGFLPLQRRHSPPLQSRSIYCSTQPTLRERENMRQTDRK